MICCRLVARSHGSAGCHHVVIGLEPIGPLGLVVGFRFSQSLIAELGARHPAVSQAVGESECGPWTAEECGYRSLLFRHQHPDLVECGHLEWPRLTGQAAGSNKHQGLLP